MTTDELRAKAREIAVAIAVQDPAASVQAIADAILDTVILPELDARVRAAREGALEEAARACADVTSYYRSLAITTLPSQDCARECRALASALARGEHRETEGE